MTMEELMGPSSWKKQRNGWKSWGLSAFFMGTRWKWSLLYINLCFLYVYIFLQLSKFKSGTFSPWTIHINPALYIKPLVLLYMLRIRARKAALKEQQVHHPKPEQHATGPGIHREPCMHKLFLYYRELLPWLCMSHRNIDV
jgi:hypothetical protein